jgi:flagellar motor switch protein FliN/FliY
MSQQLQAIAQGLSAEFANVAGSLLGVSARSGPTIPTEPGWGVPCKLDAPISGTFFLGFPKDDAAAFAGRLLMTDQVSDNDVQDALTEIAGQTLGALVTKQTVPTLAGSAGRPQACSGIPATLVTAFACQVDDALTIRVVCWFEPAAAKPAPPPAAAPVRTPAPTREPTPPPAGPDNLDILLDIDMPLSVRFGQAELTLDALTRLGPGSLIELSRQPDDPVDVLINGHLVARGEVVVVSGNYGVRITEVVSAAERLNSMHA